MNLRSKVKAKHLDKAFGKIEDLTFIHLSFLIDNIHLLSNQQFALKKLIDEYHRRISTMEKRFEKQKSMETLFSINDPFESFVTTRYADEIRTSKEYIETIVEVLNLTENLD